MGSAMLCRNRLFRACDVQRLQADPSTLSLDTDNDGNFDKNLTPDSVLDMDNLINFDPTHKPKDGIVITDNSSPSSSGGGGGGISYFTYCCSSI